MFYVIVQGAFADSGCSQYLCDGTVCVVHLQRQLYFAGIESWMSAFASSSSCSGQTFLCSFTYELTLELADTGKKCKQQPAMRCSRIKPRFLQRFDFGTTSMNGIHYFEEIFDGTAKPVQPTVNGPQPLK